MGSVRRFITSIYLHRKSIILVSVIFLSLYAFVFFLVLMAINKLNESDSVLISSKLRQILAGEVLDFTSADNVTGHPFPVVPNIIHYIKFRSRQLDFVEFICIKSALVNHRPDRLIIHCDQCDEYSQMEGKYWQMLTENNVYPISVVHHPEPTHIFGKPLSSVYHASDIARIQILMKFGGIFLDGDIYVVQSLNKFRHYEFTLGWPLNDNMGTQVLMANKNARFLKLWLESYRYYKPFMWYYNAGQLPTEDILEKQPNLVHRVPKLFGVHYLIDELYKKNWQEWKNYFTIHLLSRHRSYLDELSTVPVFDESNVKNYPYTFGEMARLLLYNTTSIIN
ncbi:hypothetical protein CHUAL_001933 [Chamberlinius hualienensis]